MRRDDFELLNLSSRLDPGKDSGLSEKIELGGLIR